MKNIEQYIAPLVEAQFPQFYLQEGPAFVAFTKAYYEWLDQGGSESRKLLEYRDVDSTIEAFIDHFKSEFLNALPATTASNTALIVKHIQDLYKSKGSSESYKLLFRLVFNEDIDVYDPSTDVLRASDGIWIVPRYIECTRSDRTVTFVGKQITGVKSGAKAFVENVVRRKINGRDIDIVYISNIDGTFQTGEYVTDNNILEGSPYITGSLNQITITSGGANNKLGDLFSITGTDGKTGKAVVRGIESGTGKVSFEILDSGYGYTTNSTILVSNAVININNVNGAFNPYMTVIQPVYRFDYSTLVGTSNTFAYLDQVTGYSSAGTQVANGYVIGTSPASNTTSGNVTISVTGGNWGYANGTIRLLSNSSVNAAFVATANLSATASIVDSNTTSIGLYNISGTLRANAFIKAYEQMAVFGKLESNIATPNVAGTNTWFSTNTSLISPDDILYFRANTGYIGVVKSVTSNTALVLYSNSVYTFSNAAVWMFRQASSANGGSLYNTGSGASFKIASLVNSETVTLYTDLLSANNSVGVPFLDMLLNGTNSNTVGYGFPGNNNVGYADVMYTALSTTTANIGTIGTIASINPGNDYNVNPLVTIRDAKVASIGNKDISVYISNTNSLFSPGQKLIQSVPIPRTTIVMSSNTGAFALGEGVIQQTSAAVGIVVSTNTTAVIVTDFGGTFVTSNNIIGQVSGANGAVSAVTPDTAYAVADGIIKTVTDTILTVRRTSYDYNFVAGSPVDSADDNGTLFGAANADLVLIESANAKYMGYNALVNTAVKTAEGIVTNIDILSSGFGYTANSELELIPANTQNQSIFGTAVVQKQGVGDGFWKNNNGKLNLDKYIHDNVYYQEYSYEIQSNLSLNTYSDILKRLLHVSGTELFGKTILRTGQDVNVDTPGVVITTT